MNLVTQETANRSNTTEHELNGHKITILNDQIRKIVIVRIDDRMILTTAGLFKTEFEDGSVYLLTEDCKVINVCIDFIIDGGFHANNVS